MTVCVELQISTLTRLQDLRLKVREIDADGVAALQTLRDLRSLDLEVPPKLHINLRACSYQSFFRSMLFHAWNGWDARMRRWDFPANVPICEQQLVI